MRESPRSWLRTRSNTAVSSSPRHSSPAPSCRWPFGSPHASSASPLLNYLAQRRSAKTGHSGLVFARVIEGTSLAPLAWEEGGSLASLAIRLADRFVRSREREGRSLRSRERGRVARFARGSVDRSLRSRLERPGPLHPREGGRAARFARDPAPLGDGRSYLLARIREGGSPASLTTQLRRAMIVRTSLLAVPAGLPPEARRLRKSPQSA